MADPNDLKGRHAREFTNHELLTLRIWFDLDSAGNDALAEKFLDAGLMLEHYTSLLDNDPSKRTTDELTNQLVLAFELQRVQQEANEFLNTVNKKSSTKLAMLQTQHQRDIDYIQGIRSTRGE